MLVADRPYPVILINKYRYRYRLHTKKIILTIDFDGGGCLHELALRYGSIPDGAAVLRPVVLLAGHHAQHAHRRLLAVSPRQEGHALAHLLLLLPPTGVLLIYVVFAVLGDAVGAVDAIPENFGGRRAADTGTGQVEGLAFGDGGIDGAEGRRRWR